MHLGLDECGALIWVQIFLSVPKFCRIILWANHILSYMKHEGDDIDEI
jgi:hypothetical protein